jgi:hypothetical protein
VTLSQHIDWLDGRSKIQIGASRGIIMLQTHSIPIKANHYIKYLYYFFYLALSSSTPHDAFPLGIRTPTWHLLAGMTNYTFALFTTQHDSYSKNIQNMLINTTK